MVKHISFTDLAIGYVYIGVPKRIRISDLPLRREKHPVFNPFDAEKKKILNR